MEHPSSNPPSAELKPEDAGDVWTLDVPLASVRCTPEGSKESVTAVWSGSPALREFSPIYGMAHLRFAFDDGSVREFVPRGWMRPSAWKCSIFSPGCRFVALLLSGHVDLYPHDGFPEGYHIVEVSHLKAYLEGREPPWATLRYSGEGGPRAVYDPCLYRSRDLDISHRVRFSPHRPGQQPRRLGNSPWRPSARRRRRT